MANTWIAPQRFLIAPLWWMWLLRITLPVKRGYSRVRSATTSRSIQVTVFCFELLATDTPHAPGVGEFVGRDGVEGVGSLQVDAVGADGAEGVALDPAALGVLQVHGAAAQSGRVEGLRVLMVRETASGCGRR